MKTTPTRPPTRSRNGGRPPRGPRPVALRPEDKKRVDQLTAAAKHLRTEGKDEWASAVEFVLTPEAGTFVNRLRVQRLRQEAAEGKFGQNLAIYTPAAVRDEVKERLAKAQRENPDKSPGQKITASSEAKKALEAFLAREFVPEQPQRAVHGSGEKRVNLNVRVDPELRQRAEDFGADHAAEFGWAPRASHIILSWLTTRFTDAGRASAE